MPWRADIESFLTRSWQKRGAIALLLLPLALAYKVLERCRRVLFAIGVFQSRRVPAKVVVIGNVIAGGAGKTPTLVALAEWLSQSGYSVGVISRGYGGTTKNLQEVLDDSDPRQVGDEPLLIRRRLSLPVFVGRDRAAAAIQLLKDYPTVDTILSDDGLQHLHLYRDLEVYVFDNRGVGNGLPLPAGPLRSAWPPSFVHTAGQSSATTVVLHTGSKPAFSGHRATRRLAAHGVRHDGTLISLKDLGSAEHPVFAVAGIAQPESFFQMLADAGVQTVRNIAYPDHWDFEAWTRPCKGDGTIVCTEKDAVKLWRHEPAAVAIPLIQELDPSLLAEIRGVLGTPTRQHS